MLATRQAALRRFWYPVMPVATLDDGQLHAFTLLGEPLVLWRTADQEIACLRDRCCHRTAKLSLGFLEQGNVVCGYHGWAFAPGGRCVKVPQQAEGTPIASKASVPAYRAVERYGYVWVLLAGADEAALADIPELPEAADAGYRQIPEFYEPWQIGALRLMENSFDNAHVAYVHRATFGDVQDARPSQYEIVDRSEVGFLARTAYRVMVRGDAAQEVTGTSHTETVRTTTSQWFMPFTRRTSIQYPTGLVHTLITSATPIDDHTSMIVQWVYRNDKEEDTSAASVVAFDRAVTLEDRKILESCEPDVPLAVVDGEELHMSSDRPGLVMRSLLAAMLGTQDETEQRAPKPIWMTAPAARA